mmetsp:Transcript_6292/g.13723  ORF Transcript_6292/g.13723 Transcript_6292/m.13723 type:complete len:334 (+) Transcript_6292:20-1021(+)
MSRWEHSLYIGPRACRECGEYFLRSDYIEENVYDCCSACKAQQLWSPTATAYRAIQGDENVLEEGFRPANSHANVCEEYHVLHGSDVDTQFISFTYKLECAVYFSVKGFIERDEVARVAVVELPFGKFDEVAPVLRDRTAKNYAKVFEEFLATEKDTEYIRVEKLLHLTDISRGEFEDSLGNFRDFMAAYQRSELQDQIRSAIGRTKLNCTLDLVGLRHYRSGHDNIVTRTRLELDDSNMFDPNNAVRVEGTVDDRLWFTLGYLSREHASVVRCILPKAQNRDTTLNLPDLTLTYETKLDLQFEFSEFDQAKSSLHMVRDNYGRASFEPEHFL